VMSLVQTERHVPTNEELREFLQADACTLWGIESADVWFSLMLKRYYAVHEGLIWELLNNPGSSRPLARFLGALNVKYVIAPRSVTLTGWENVYQTDRAGAWKNPAFLPRAFLVGSVIPENTEVREAWLETSQRRLERYAREVADWRSRHEDAQVLDHILSQPIDYRQTAVVATDEVLALSGLDPESAVRSIIRRPDVMQISVWSRKPALLFVSSNYYPGWTASVNGTPARLYRTNWVGMGIYVQAGQSDVTLRFATPGLRLGLLVSLLSIAGWILAMTPSVRQGLKRFPSVARGVRA